MESNKQTQKAGDNSTQMQAGTINNYNISIVVESQNCVQDSLYGENKGTIKKSLFSNEECGKIIKWVQSGNSTGKKLTFEGEKSLFMLGSSQYEVADGRDKAEWDDFMERLIESELVEIEKYNNQGVPVYKLKKAAYDYVDSITEKKD